MTDTLIKKLCLFGPQGSGKGTQAEKLVAHFGLPQLSPGNIFRKAMAEQSALGREVASYMDAGHLVPNHITNALMKGRLEAEDCVNGFILDGYPRNAIQADALDSLTTLTHVLVIVIPDTESIDRISKRRVCPDCGSTYHPDVKPATTEGVCDVCGHLLVQRSDDTPAAIQQRLDIYHKETEPLLERYAERGIMHRIDGTLPIDEVWEVIRQLVE